MKFAFRGARSAHAAALGVALALTAGLAPGARSQGSPPDYKNPNLPVERRVADLLARMTVEEKVAQTIALWDKKILVEDDQGKFSPEKAKTVMKDGIGEIARPSERRGTGVAQGANRGPREGAEYVNAIQKFLVENTRLGIPALCHEESLHGLTAPKGTSFPQAIGLGSTWNPDLLERIFTVAAREARARGIHHVLAPVVDLAREPRWGRTEECLGEDPYHVSRMGVAIVKGFQGAGPGLDDAHVFATAKHFTGHGQPEGGVNVAPAPFSERVLRETFFVPFHALVKEAGVMSVMPSYNEVDGVPPHGNSWLLQDVLRQEWGFQGMISSDYFGVAQLDELHHVAADKEDAARMAVKAGVNMELPDVDCYGTLAKQIREGKVAIADLDAIVVPILRAKFLAGLFENPYVDPAKADEIANTPESQALALQAARETLVLLKNKGNLLPLDQSKIKTMAVIGPNAKDLHLGGYSGNFEGRRGITVLQGIQNKLGANRVVYAEGCKITETPPDWYADRVVLGDPTLNAKRIEEAVKVARTADVVLLAIGDNEATCREAWAPNHLGDRDSLDLLGEQNDLVKAILATGKPTVVLLFGGRPLSINYVNDTVPAILEGWYLGQEGGTAVAEVLFGDYNPGGKLPITFPRGVGQLPAYYYQKPSAKRGFLFDPIDPLYPFGFGLSYTTFAYSKAKLAQTRIGIGGTTTVSVDVKNTGTRAGDEVVQMYIRDRVSSVTRPVRELKGFERVSLKPGETRTVTFQIAPDALAFWNSKMEHVVEPGLFDVMVGPSSVKYDTLQLEVVRN
jgi:beta-glucosidase